ncbi:MAG: alkaline phosphatase family protein [Gemmatimonadota bacterium]
MRAEAPRRGFVAIQLDALAYDDLERAIRNGYAPTIKGLIEKEGWALRRFAAGLPSTTPAAQAAIFYGTKDGIPGFRFYEKGDDRLLIGSKPAAMQVIRDRLPESGVLDGGSSYVNLFDGGAARSAFTMAAREPQPLLANLGGTRVALLLLFHPVRTLRMVLVSGLEYIREERDRFVSQLRGRSTWYWWYLPLLHIGTSVVLRELQTLAVLLDIYVGVPSIYTTYNVYDEFAHHFGPSSRTAMKSVRALDRRVREIVRMTRRSPGRPYDVYVLSDHGQTPSEPYRMTYGETLGQTIEAAAKKGVAVLAGSGVYAPPRETLDFLLREAEAVADASHSEITRAIGPRLIRWLRSQYSVFPLVAETTRVADDRELVVTYSSSLAHVYWTDPPEPLELRHIQEDPRKQALYYFLVAHSGIGVVVTRFQDGAHVEGRGGRAVIDPAGELVVLDGENPLEDYGTGHEARMAVAHLAALSNSGDLVLFGAYDPESDTCVCFDDQVGAHGALGGRQFWPFFLSADGTVPEDLELRDPLDLHPVFARYPLKGGAPQSELIQSR